MYPRAVLFALALTCISFATMAAEPVLPELNWTERSDWVNVKTDVTPAAVGDGMADDTAAIQAALDLVSKDGKDALTTVYMPPGTYRITETLHQANTDGMLWVGHGRSTRIEWHGAADSERGMYWSDGVPRSRYIGMVWDGRGVGTVGHDHGSTTRFETRIHYQHVAFQNLTKAGVRTGYKRRVASAETVYENCLFLNTGIGAHVVLHNDYNQKFIASEFRDCEFGIKSQKGHIQVYNSHFERNGTDISHDGDQAPSIRRCTSIGSGQFVASHQSPITIQDCWVSGWTGKAGAIIQHGAPMTIFDCTFENPPDDAAPIRVSAGKILTYSNVVSTGTRAAVSADGEGTRIVEIPAGARRGIITSASQSFFISTAEVPTKVFDAKADFGAVGDGVADDTDAVLKAVAAAQAHGQGAVAYFPAGTYNIAAAIPVAGGHYSISGSGFQTIIRGLQTEGAMVAVVDPQDVKLEHMRLEPKHPEQVAAIHQTSTGRRSYIRYDGLYTPGTYWKTEPRPRGLYLDGLGAGDVVNIGVFDGDIRATTSARATILGQFTYEGQIQIDGDEPVRDGFFGIVFRLSTGGSTYSLTVENNHSVVIGDFYNENALRHVHLSGKPGEPAGQVTLQGARYYSKCVMSKNVDEVDNPVMLIENYGGVFSWGQFSFDYWKSDILPQVVQTGDRPLEMVFLSTRLFHSKPLDFQTTDATNLTLIGNTWSDTVATEAGLAAAAKALDHLRQLGDVDLQLNHSHHTHAAIAAAFLATAP